MNFGAEADHWAQIQLLVDGQFVQSYDCGSLVGQQRNLEAQTSVAAGGLHWKTCLNSNAEKVSDE